LAGLELANVDNLRNIMEKQNVIPPENGKKQASTRPEPKFDKLADAETKVTFDFSKDKILKK